MNADPPLNGSHRKDEYFIDENGNFEYEDTSYFTEVVEKIPYKFKD